MWKPGQLVTINGILYRVKHADVPANCYLERMSPIIKIVQ